MNGYDLTRKWFDFAMDNPDTVSSNHTALYLWLIELNNRLGWSEKFSITVRENMNGMSCRNRNTYSKCIHDIEEWKFLKVIVKSTNQYQCNVISLTDRAQVKTKRLFKNDTSTDIGNDTTTGISSGNSTDTIHKTNKPINHKTVKDSFSVFWDLYDKKRERIDCEKVWSSLTSEDRDLILIHVPYYVSETPDFNFRKDPIRYLKKKMWMDEIQTKSSKSDYEPTNEVKPLVDNDW